MKYKPDRLYSTCLNDGHDLIIDDEVFFKIVKLAKKYEILEHTNTIGSIAFWAICTFKKTKLQDKGIDYFDRRIEEHKLSSILESDIYEISFKGMNGKIKIVNKENISIIKRYLSTFFFQTRKSVKSISKVTSTRYSAFIFGSMVYGLLCKEKSSKLKSNVAKYRVVNQFFEICGYSITGEKKNGISLPEELIKKLLQDFEKDE